MKRMKITLTDTDGLGKWIEGPNRERLREKLRNAINAMQGRKYEVWQLLLQGKSHSEIAEILNLTRGAVFSYYNQGIKAIRKLVKS